MTKKHDAVLDDVLGAIGDAPPPRAKRRAGADRGAGRFLARSNALAERLSGDAVEKTLHWVDPERCRMWARHNRRYDLLNEQRCADLIEGFKAQGRQEFPAIVRAIEGDPEHDYEVVCGARRHWTVSWLRRHNYRDFRFLIEVRDLDDEAAFRLSDVENRDRTDICDYERALDYAAALEAYYGGRQKEMAARLEVSETWLSRFLALSRLPKPIVEAYGDVTHIRESHARDLKPLMARNADKALILEEARALGRAQRDAELDGAAVLRRLKAAVAPKKPARAAALDLRDDAGKIVARVQRKRGRAAQIDLKDASDMEEALEFCRRALALLADEER